MASLSTDTGHSATSADTTWARNQPEKKTDWGWRAIHGSTVLGKQLVQAYYGDQALGYSYYSGCSTGGRQGLKELQNFPDSFDGALIGAPAWWTSHLNNYVTQAGLVRQVRALYIPFQLSRELSGAKLLPNYSYHFPNRQLFADMVG